MTFAVDPAARDLHGDRDRGGGRLAGSERLRRCLPPAPPRRRPRGTRRVRPARARAPSGSPAPEAGAIVRFAVDLFDVDESTITPGSGAGLEALGTTDGCRDPSAQPGARRGTADPVAARPAARDELWIPLLIVVLVLLCIEWAVYERDSLSRGRRALAGAARATGTARTPVAARRGRSSRPGALTMGIAFTDPLVLAAPAGPARPDARSSTSARDGGSGTFRRRASLAHPGAAPRRAHVRPRRLPARAAGRPAGHRVRRGPVRFGRPGRAGPRPSTTSATSLVAMPHDDMAGIVAFGKDALVERLPAEVRELDAISSVPVQGATDIGGAMRLAAALFPDDAQKRIVLLSDGNDTTGAGQAEAALAAAQRIQVQTHVIGLGGAAEVLVERVTTPTTAHIGEDIEAKAVITSTVAQLATVRLFADGGLVATQQVNLAVGQTTVTFQVKAKDAGFHIFRVVVDAGQDTFSQNNRADSDTIVKGEPRILVVAGDPAVGSQLVGALRTEHQTVDTVLPEAMPADLAGLANYDSVVLVDVPAAG